MTHLWGALMGLLIGGLAGAAKHLLLWRPVLKGKRAFDMKSFGSIQLGSMAINIATLLGIFALRHRLPFSPDATLIAAAVALSIMSRLSPLRDLQKMEELSSEEEREQ